MEEPQEQQEPKKKRGRPRKYDRPNQFQGAWKRRSGFESSEARKAYKAEWARENRRKKKETDKEGS
jgi:hypothetical protein